MKILYKMVNRMGKGLFIAKVFGIIFALCILVYLILLMPINYEGEIPSYICTLTAFENHFNDKITIRDIEESKKWIDFLNDKNISYINWSFSYKNESSALLLESYGNNLTQDFNNYLSESGKFIKSIINVY